MAGKLEREAQQQAVDAYNKEWKKLKRIEGAQEKKLNTRTVSKIEDQFGEDVGYNTKRLAMKADKVGKNLNKLQPKFKEAVDAYNRRFDEFRRQKNNQSVSGEFMNEVRGNAQKEYDSLRTQREAAEREKNDPFKNILGGMNGNTNTIQSMMQGDKSPYREVMGHYMPTKDETRAQDMSMNADMYYGPATTWRKTLPAHEQAAKDFNQLGDKVAENKEYQVNAQAYKELGDKLKQKLRMEGGMIKARGPATGLLASDTVSAQGPVAGEVLP